MFEEQEENLEEWWKGHQETDPDLLVWLCIDKMKGRIVYYTHTQGLGRNI